MDLTTVRALAATTPATRNRVVDLLRAGAICVVVLGHWLIAAVVVRDGELVPGHLLELASWTHPLTWVFQVMPVFFLVGGYANAASLTSHYRKGWRARDWLVHRAARLVRPSTALILVLAAGAGLARLWGLDPR